jgi:hypothetical protein
METLTETKVLPLLKQKYNLHGIIKARVIHLAGIGESVVDDAIGDLERLSNPTVGLLAHPGIVDIRITAKALSEGQAEEMIEEIQQRVIALFPNKIFGFDEETLPNAITDLAKKKRISISIDSRGLTGFWPLDWITGDQEIISIQSSPQSSNPVNCNYDPANPAFIQTDFCFSQIDGESKVDFFILTPSQEVHFSNLYNGPSAQGGLWAMNIFLEHLRQTLLNLETQKGME